MGGVLHSLCSGQFLCSTRTGTGIGSLVLAARARQAIKFAILTIYVLYTIGNVWRERVASTAPGRTRAALEMPSLPSNVTHSDFGLTFPPNIRAILIIRIGVAL